MDSSRNQALLHSRCKLIEMDPRSGTALTGFVYRRTVQPQRKLGSWVDTLTGILGAEDKLPRRERRSTIRLFEELRGRGYDGAHDSVHRFVKSWQGATRRSGGSRGGKAIAGIWLCQT